MAQDCVSIYDALTTPPHPYTLALYNCLLLLPVVAGLSLVARRIKGQRGIGINIGALFAGLYTCFLLADWFHPESMRALLPSSMRNLIFLCLFGGTMIDWTVQVLRNRMKVFATDAIVMLLIILSVGLGIASYRIPSQAICSASLAAVKP
jgi:hypothetical protein